MLQAARSIQDGCRLLRLKWDAAQRLLQRAVERGLQRRRIEELHVVGLDEKSFGAGQDYVSLLVDLKEARVLEVTQGNDAKSAGELWLSLPPEQRVEVKAAAMDMSAGFAAATAQHAPQAVIVHDRFHVSKMLNEAVDKVRRSERKVLNQQGDDRLAGTRQLWLYDPANLSDERYAQFMNILQENLKTGRAWLHKENFRGFWDQPGWWAAEGYFKRWYASAIRSRLEPVKKVARSLKEHIEGLLNYTLYPITNAVTEGLNAKIQQIKASARGFRNFKSYRLRILFHCGKLDLMPLLPTPFLP